MITTHFKIKGQDVNLSWSQVEIFKKVIGAQTSHFGGRPEDLTDKLLKERIEYEYQPVINFVTDVPDLSAITSLLDIGSGTSIVDLALCSYFKNKVKFYLLDGERLDRIGRDNIFDKGCGPFNQWDPVHDAIETNGFDKEKFSFLTSNHSRDIEKYNSQWEALQVDMVISISSWGLHYPIEAYWDKVMRVLKPGGYLVISPVVSIDNQYEFICSKFGPPIKLHEYTVEVLKKYRPNDFIRWQNLMPSTDTPSAIWGRRAIWQRPL